MSALRTPLAGWRWRVFVAIGVVGCVAIGAAAASENGDRGWPILGLAPKDTPLQCEAGLADVIFSPGAIREAPKHQTGEDGKPITDFEPPPPPAQPTPPGFPARPANPDEVARNVALSEARVRPGTILANMDYRVADASDRRATIVGEHAGRALFLAPAVRLEDGSWTWEDASLELNPDGLWTWHGGVVMLCSKELLRPA